MEITKVETKDTIYQKIPRPNNTQNRKTIIGNCTFSKRLGSVLIVKENKVTEIFNHAIEKIVYIK